MSKVTIGFVTWNGARYLKSNLEALLLQSNQDFELLMMDNGSTDGTIEILQEYKQKFGERCSLTLNSENFGFAKGHNMLMRQSQSQYYMALNQDIVLDKEYIELCAQVLDSNPLIGSVSGKILVWDFVHSVFTSTIDSLGLEIKRWGQVIEKNVGEQDSSEVRGNIEVFGVSGTVPLYSKKALEAVAFNSEFFDESFFSYKEDVDLAFRLRWAGYTSYVVTDARAYHDRGAKSTENMTFAEAHLYRRQKKSLINYHSYKNHLAIIAKNYSWEMLLFRFPWLFLYEVSKFVYIGLTEIQTLSSLKDFVRLWGSTIQKRKFIQKHARSSYRQMLAWMR